MPRQVIKKNELVILLISLLVFAILLTLTTIYYRSGDKKEKSEEELVVVEGSIAPKGQNENRQPEEKSETIGSEAFFLTPTAADVLTALREADPYAEQPDLEDAPAMKVMWPGFYFPDQEVVENNGEIIIQLDVDESGFGVILVCTIKLTDYPEVKTLQPGQQIWVAGEVTEIDMEGTGTVHITVEYIRFDEGPTASRKSSP